MTDWYRRNTWTRTDEEEFFLKLGRARTYSRAQYLRVQAIELIETKDNRLITVAEKLLLLILSDFPDSRTEKSQTFNQLGEIYLLREDYDKALDYFRKSLDFEKEFPSVITTAYLNFSETVIKAHKTELYKEVEHILTDKLKKEGLKFPFQNYIIYSVLTVISDFEGETDKAKYYSVLAEKNAITKNNSLWNPKKKSLGTVKERISWLEKLVRRK